MKREATIEVFSIDGLLPIYLETRNMFELERIGHGTLLSYLIVHGIDVGLIDRHAFLGQRRRVIDWKLVKFRMCRPVLVYGQK